MRAAVSGQGVKAILLVGPLEAIQWNLSIKGISGTQLAVLYTVVPLNKGHLRDPAGCPVYSGTSQ